METAAMGMMGYPFLAPSPIMKATIHWPPTAYLCYEWWREASSVLRYFFFCYLAFWVWGEGKPLEVTRTTSITVEVTSEMVSVSHNGGMERRVYRKLPVDGSAAPATLYIYIYKHYRYIFDESILQDLHVEEGKTFDYLPCWCCTILQIVSLCHHRQTATSFLRWDSIIIPSPPFTSHFFFWRIIRACSPALIFFFYPFFSGFPQPNPHLSHISLRVDIFRYRRVNFCCVSKRKSPFCVCVRALLNRGKVLWEAISRSSSIQS